MNAKLYGFTVKNIADASRRSSAAVRRDIARGSLKPDNLVSVSKYVVAGILTRRKYECED